MDPDGWDRNNLSYSLQEVISEGEFKRRLSASSGHFNRMAEEDEANLQLGQDITNTMDITQQDGY